MKGVFQKKKRRIKKRKDPVYNKDLKFRLPELEVCLNCYINLQKILAFLFKIQMPQTTKCKHTCSSEIRQNLVTFLYDFLWAFTFP